MALSMLPDNKETEEIINDVITAVEQWPEYAKEAGVKKKASLAIRKQHRTKL